MLEQLQATMKCELTIFFNFISKGMNRTEEKENFWNPGSRGGRGWKLGQAESE